MHALVHELGAALWRLTHRPGYSLAVLLTLGIGIALSAGLNNMSSANPGYRTAVAIVAGVIGSVVAFAVLRLLANQLFGVSPADPGLYLFGIAAVAVMALAATALPAWRAARIAPVEALHYE